MRIHIAILFSLTATACTPKESIVELPHPNPGTFSIAQTAAEKSELYTMSQSGMLSEWNIRSLAFALHITKSDEIVRYGGWKTTIAEVKELLKIKEEFQSGAALRVLITTEMDPKKSSMLSVLITTFLGPSIKIFYLRKGG